MIECYPPPFFFKIENDVTSLTLAYPMGTPRVIRVRSTDIEVYLVHVYMFRIWPIYNTEFIRSSTYAWAELSFVSRKERQLS